MKKYLGLDIGGTKIMYMLASENGEILAREKVPTVKDAQLL